MPEPKKTTEQKKTPATKKMAEKTPKPSKVALKKKTVGKKADVVVAETTPRATSGSSSSETTSLFEGRYFEAVGRRKTAVARVRLYAKENGEFVVNKKDFNVYFPTEELRMLANGALRKIKANDKFAMSVLVKGGGFKAQAEATRLGSARALLKFDGELRERLKHAGYLRRDPREVERKKYGLKKARRKPQWTKR